MLDHMCTSRDRNKVDWVTKLRHYNDKIVGTRRQFARAGQRSQTTGLSIRFQRST